MEELSLPISFSLKKKIMLTNSMRDLNNQLNMLKVTIDQDNNKTEEIHFSELTESILSKNEAKIDEKDNFICEKIKEKNSKLLSKLADLKTIFDLSKENKIESTHIYRSNILKEHRRDIRESILNANRDLKNVRLNKNSSNQFEQQCEQIPKIDDYAITIVDINIQQDIIYCNSKPLGVE